MQVSQPPPYNLVSRERVLHTKRWQTWSAILKEILLVIRRGEISISVDTIQTIQERNGLVQEGRLLVDSTITLELSDPDLLSVGDWADLVNVFFEVGEVCGLIVPVRGNEVDFAGSATIKEGL